MYLYNALLYTPSGEKNGAVNITNGKIAEILEAAPPEITGEDIDCKGYTLYPGFIDAHTHLGLIEDGLGFEGDDSNEETDPINPQLRVIDGINPLDNCFKEAFMAGVTTVAVSPGSADPIAGEILALKTVGRRADDMSMGQIGMKFALGENPKTVYSEKNVAPITRMATAALMRETLFKAVRYAADVAAAAENPDLSPPEFDIKSEALLPLLERKIAAHFHAHRADDIFTALRIAKEFNLRAVIIHATEGHIIADILAKEGIPAIVGPILCDRCKPEMRHLSTDNAAILAKNGVPICLCTDHPVIPVQYLPLSAAIAVKSGLPVASAIDAITINAAKILGIEEHVGSIEVGKDADFALFQTSPLDVMASPALVMINGNTVLNNI